MATLIPAETDYGNGGDRISELPDDILMNFVSLMGMKEAAKTSIFSKRWRYLCAKWTHLDFSHLIILPDSDPDVNTHASTLSKSVLDLITRVAVYTLTFDILKPTLGVGESGVNFLQSLHLNGINVSVDILEYLLVQCCLLERLHVEGSETLVRFKVFGSSCKLKQLTIFGCRNLEQLEIDAVNLLYLRYRTSNPCTNVVFKNMHMLVEAMFGGYCLPDSTTIFRQLSHLAGQISKLTLDLVCLAIPIELLPTFCKVKQLTLIVIGHTEFDLVVISHFLKACPVLQEFTLEITWRSDELEREAYELEQVDPSINDFEDIGDWEYFELLFEMELERTNHPNLEELKVVGFNGCNADVELVLFIMLFTCNLKTLICDSSRCDNIPVKEVMEASRSQK